MCPGVVETPDYRHRDCRAGDAERDGEVRLVIAARGAPIIEPGGHARDLGCIPACDHFPLELARAALRLEAVVHERDVRARRQRA